MKKMLLVLFLIANIAFTGCSVAEEAGKPTKISAEDAKKRLDVEKDIILVDVRTLDEYNEAHIPEAILLTLDTISEKAEKVLQDKEATYFVYCRSGSRSATASAQLVKMGYKNIYDMGGIIDWPYETVVEK